MLSYFSSSIFKRNFSLSLYNSITKNTISLPSKPLTFYICGPTVYDKSHLGHARTYVCFDIINRLIKNYFNIPITVAMGITDIDDKIIKVGKENYKELAKKYELEFMNDMKKLNVIPPNVYLRVSEHIPQIIVFIEKLLNYNPPRAYIANSGSVYFDSDIYEKSGFCLHKMRKASDPLEEEELDEKRKKLDFCLWKNSEIGFNSPWGKGRPGWHIECSAFNQSFFGNQLDMHGGGIDLQLHHENEIAQCEAYNNHDWCNIFIHTGHLFIENRKMSKSLKNFISIEEYFENSNADEFRMICLSKHYTGPLDYTPNLLSTARSKIEQFDNFFSIINEKIAIGKSLGNNRILSYSDEENKLRKVYKLLISFILFFSFENMQVKVKESLSNNFDTPNALASFPPLFSAFFNYVNFVKIPHLELLESINNYLLNFVQLVGLQKWSNSNSSSLSNESLKLSINSILALRKNIKSIARKSKKPVLFALSDFARDELTKLGVKIVDKDNDEFKFILSNKVEEPKVIELLDTFEKKFNEIIIKSL